MTDLIQKQELKRFLTLKSRELFGIDLRSLALFRIALGLLIIADLVIRSFSLKSFYTDQSLLPRHLAIWGFSGEWDLSLNFLSGTLTVQIVLFLIAGILGLFLILGYQTRWVTFLSWFFILSLQHRNTLVNEGSDFILRLLLFWGIFVPLGARFSLDHLLRSQQKKIPKSVLSVGTAVLLLQTSIIYLFAVWAKSRSDVWQNGTAAYYALSLEHFSTPIGHSLLRFPGLLRNLTYAVFGTELICSLLLFVPVFTAFFRIVAILALFALQLGFGACLDLNLFPWISFAATLPFIPSCFWDRFSGNWVHGEKTLKGILNKLTAGPDHFQLSRWTSFFVVYCFVFILTTNLELVTGRTLIPKELRWTGEILDIDQGWNMFVPPGTQSYWFVIPGKLKDGSEVDLFNDGEPVSWEKPASLLKRIKNRHWRGYLLTLWGRSDLLSPYLGTYLCSQWNQHHSGEKQVTELDIYGMSQENLFPPQSTVPQKQFLFHHPCE